MACSRCQKRGQLIKGAVKNIGKGNTRQGMNKLRVMGNSMLRDARGARLRGKRV
jgi:hypothetical protein